MILLLDSQALFITTFEPERLPARVREHIIAPETTLLASAISPYELELKKALGKLRFPNVADWENVIAAQGCVLLSVSVAHGVAAARLPFHHRDPWDRIIVAQAMAAGAAIASSDRLVARYGVRVIW